MVNSLLSLAKKEVSASKQVSKPGQVKRAPVDPLAEFARKYNEGGNRPATPLPKPTAATKVPVSQRLTPEGIKARAEELYGPNPGERDKSKTVFSKRRRDVGDALFGLDFLRSNMDPEEFEQVKGVAGSYIMSRIGGYKKGDTRTRPQDKAQVDPLLAAQEFLQLSARGDQKTIFDSINRFKKTRASQAKQNELAGALREEDRYKQVISNPFSNYYLTEGQKRDMAAAPGGDIRGVDLTSAGFTAAGEIVRNNVNDATRVNAARAWVERMRKDPSEKTLAEGLAMFGAEAYAFLGDQVGGLAGMVPDVGGDIVNLVSPTTPGVDRAGAGINTTLKALGILGGGAVAGRAGMEAGAALRAGNKLGAAKAVGRGVGELVSPIPLGGEAVAARGDAPVARPVEAPAPKAGPVVGSKAPQFKVSKQNPWTKPEKPVAVPSPAEARAAAKAKLEAIKGAKVPEKKPWEMSQDERAAEVKRIEDENRAVLATPLASEGSISPLQVSKMSSRQQQKWRDNAQQKMAAQSEIRRFEKPEEAKAASDAAAKRKTDGRILQLERRREDLLRFGVGKRGPLKPTYAAELAKVDAELESLKGTNPQQDIPKSAVKEATASEKGKQTRKGIEEGKQEGLLKPDAGAAPVAPVSKARVVTMEIDGVKRTATLTPEQSAKWDAEVATHEQRVKHYKDQQRRLNRNGSIDTSDAANLKAEGMRHAASKRKIAGLLTATERAAQDEFNSKIRAGDTVILKDGRVGEVVQNPAFGMTKVKVGGTVERVEHVSLTKTEPPKATNAKPPATPAPEKLRGKAKREAALAELKSTDIVTNVKKGGKQAGSVGLNPKALKLYADVAESYIEDGVDWVAKVVKELGDEVAPHVDAIKQELVRRGVLKGIVLDESEKALSITGIQPKAKSEVNRSFAERLQGGVRKTSGGEKIDTTVPENREKLARVFAHDAAHEIATNPTNNALGWYERKVSEALRLATKQYPEVANNESARGAYTYALAVTSNGQRVNDNFKFADKVYAHWKRTGQMPLFGAGAPGKQMKAAFKFWNDNVPPGSDATSFMKFLNTDFTVAEAKAMGINVSGEWADQIVSGGHAIGPKIGGGFLRNLSGHFDSLTSDRWFQRTWGRMTGNLVEESVSKESALADKLKQTLPDVSDEELARYGFTRDMADDDEALAKLAKDVHKQFSKKNAAGKTYTDKRPFTQTAKNLDDFVKATNDAPTAANRAHQRMVVTRAKELLRQEYGIDITTADLQALVWYPEQRAWGAGANAVDYADAARAQYGHLKTPELKTPLTDPSYKLGSLQGKDRLVEQRSRVLGRLRRQLYGGDSGRANGRSLPPAYARRSNKSRSAILADGSKVDVSGTFSMGQTWKNAIDTLRRPNGSPDIPTPPIHEIKGGDFHRLISDAKQSLGENGLPVHVYTPEEYEGMRVFVVDDGTAGFAIKPDGDIVSVFRHGDSQYPGVTPSMMQLAIDLGGKKLDAFDTATTALPKIYGRSGFREVARLPFDVSKAPPGWNVKTMGEPDVVFMVHDPSFHGGKQPKAPYAVDYGAALKLQSDAIAKHPVSTLAQPDLVAKPTATEKLRGKALRDASLDRLAELKAKPNKPMKGGKQAGSINIDPEVFNIYVDIAKSYVDEGVDWTKAILDDLKDEVAPHVVAIKRELVRRGVLEGEKPTQSIGAPSGEEKVRLLSASPDDPRLDPFDDAFDEKYAGRVAEALGADNADDVARALRDHQQKVQETITTRELEGENAKRASQALRDLAQSGRAPKAAYVWRRDARRKGYQWFLDKKQPVALVDLSTLPDDIRNAVVDKIASGAYDEELRYVVGDKADSFPERFYSNPKGTLRPSEIVTEEVGGTRGTGIGEDRFYAPRHLVEKIAQEYGAVARKGAGDVATKVIADVTGATKKEAGMWNKRPAKPKVKGRTTAVSQAGTGRDVNPGTSAEGWQERGTKAYLDGRVDIEARTREVLDGGRMMDPEEIAGAKAFLVDVEAKMKAIRNANPNTYAGRADYQRLEKFFDDVPEAVGKSGSYASELFRSLQGYAKDDYSFEKLWKDVRAANAGAGKNEKLRAEFEGMAKQIEDLESKLKKQVAEYNANKRMARAGAPVNSRTYGASNKVVTKDTYSAALDRIKARANALQEGGTVSASSIMDPELLKDMAIWAGYHVEAGVRTLADLATKAKEDGVDATTEELAEAVRVHLDEQDALRTKRTKTGPTKADLRKEVARPGVPDPASPKFQKGQEFGVDVLIDDTTGSGIKDPEIGRTRVQLLRAKSEARKMVEEERMMADYRGKNLLGKAWVQVRDVNNMARTFLTVFDNSIPGRQGFYTLVSDPKTWGKGFMRSWKGFTPKGLENVLVETEAFPRFNQAIKDGHLKLGAFNHVPEEDFLGSKKLQRLPGVKQSEGMADAFTNYTRMARYQKLSDLFEVSIGKELSPEQRKLIAGFVNSETGAGHVPAQLKGLSELMFSARFASSRIENMLMADVWRANKMKDKDLAKFFALQYVKRKIAMTAIVGIVAGAEQLTGKNMTDADPRSAEGFGKLREGKFTYDLTAGSSQYESLVWRLVSKSLGKGGVGMDAPKQNPNLRPMDVAARLSSGRGATDRGQDGIDYASDFFINKLSPVPRAVAGHFLSPEWKKKNFKDGESYAKHVAKSNLPISVQNAMDQNSNNVPAPRIMANWIIDALGISVGGEATRDASTNRGK